MTVSMVWQQLTRVQGIFLAEVDGWEQQQVL